MILNSSTNLKTLKMIYESFKCICSAPPAGGRWEEVTLLRFSLFSVGFIVSQKKDSE